MYYNTSISSRASFVILLFILCLINLVQWYRLDNLLLKGMSSVASPHIVTNHKIKYDDCEKLWNNIAALFICRSMHNLNWQQTLIAAGWCVSNLLLLCPITLILELQLISVHGCIIILWLTLGHINLPYPLGWGDIGFYKTCLYKYVERDGGLIAML